MVCLREGIRAFGRIAALMGLAGFSWRRDGCYLVDSFLSQ